MLASAAAQSYTQIQAGKAAKDAAKRNAQVARQAEYDAKKRGQYEEYRHRQKIAALIGRQRALIGSSGAMVDQDSALDIVADAEAMGELDALMTRTNAAREAWGYEQQANNFGFEQHMADIQAKWGAGATLVGGTASALGGYQQLKNS